MTSKKIIRPKLVVVAGPNGSGKTTLTEQVIAHHWAQDCEYINPDNIAQNELGNWNAPENVLQAAKIAEQRRLLCVENQHNLAFETVLSTPEKISFLQQAKAKGYFIRVFFVGTDHPGINASRITLRVMQGGHDVPIPKIISRYTKSIANCAALAHIADRCYVYDNSIENVRPRLLFKVVEGRIAKSYSHINSWALCISEHLPTTRLPKC